MKIFIVFLGLLIINVSFLLFQTDMTKYVEVQVLLKAIAEESAAGAALYFEEEKYADGNFVFDYGEGKKYAEYIINNEKDNLRCQEIEKLEYDMKFQDDYLGYEGKERIPSVEVKIDVYTEDLFRLPFLKLSKISRISKYELPEL